MFKRILSLFLALMLLPALVPAQAEASIPAELYRIVLREETGDVTLGTGVLFGSRSTLLTAAGCWADGNLYAIGQDGEHAISYRGTVIGTQLITLGLATESAATPLTVTGADYLMDYQLYGVKADGTFVTMTVRGSRVVFLDDRGEALLYAQEGMLPGAVMFGDDYGLACMTVWQSTEGEGAYATVADVTLQRLFPANDESDDNGQPLTLNSLDSDRLLRGFTAACKDGQIIVDWSDARGYVLTENTIFTVFLTVTSNTYLTRAVMKAGETSATFPAIPGTEAMIWIVVSEGEPTEDLYPQESADVKLVTVPRALPFEINGLKNLRCAITPGEPGMDGVTEDFLPQEPLTREALSDRSRPIYFMTEDVYTCTREDDDHTLMVTLYTPEGYSFYYFSGYVFMPEYSQSDLWISDISDVFADYERFCEGEPWPAGEYTILYTIDGGEVARFTFSLD